jgi:Tfp pilus assembly protein PilX
MATNRRTARHRGSALIVAIILVAVMAVVGLALIRRTSNEIDSVSSKRHYDVAVSCADGARQMLMSSFRTFGLPPTQLSLDKTVNDKRLTSGHYDTFAVQSVVVATGASFSGGTVGASDIVNRTRGAGQLGGTMYRMTVVCTDSSSATRQSEVEYLVRFGL